MALLPLEVLNTARRAVPVVDFALGAAGIAAAGAIVVGFLGYSRATFVIFGGMLIAMLLLIVCARLLSARSAPILAAGIAMVWAVALFFITFLVFTATAVAMKWPNVWASLLLGDPPIQAATLSVCALAGEKAVGSCGSSSGRYVVTNIRFDDSDHGLVVRNAPNLNGIPVGLIPPNGTEITVGECSGEWCPVECKNTRGWSRARYLTSRSAALFSVAKSNSSEPQEVIVRNGPDQFCPSIGSIPVQGRDIIVHTCEPGPTDKLNWCRVTYSGMSGFALATRLASQN
ncbi:SH3 domain-containing protein [Bradyrhizobium sp. Y36]|uniref:SH3 domain-containing protein n=1 Tax=Bradyrhizobium sp. Y36 TaxID=2035447 RepID=UPI00117751A6|nr:SH3 domain-containing protein [Bradyrhizobium sp. Y36]